jgi:hypothetical protein
LFDVLGLGFLTKEEKKRHRALETATCISGKEKQLSI